MMPWPSYLIHTMAANIMPVVAATASKAPRHESQSRKCSKKRNIHTSYACHLPLAGKVVKSDDTDEGVAE